MPTRAEMWGIDTTYEDFDEKLRKVPPATVERLLEVISRGEEKPNEQRRTIFSSPDRQVFIDPGADILLEEGGEVPATQQEIARLPFGYHLVRYQHDGSVQRLIHSPGKCMFPKGMRTWGWALQLYALRSRNSWGIGDLADLREFAFWAASGLGARMVLINPISAVTGVKPIQPSPYYPSSRCFKEPLYIAVEEVLESLSIDGSRYRTRADELNSKRIIDRDAVFDLKMQALEEAWKVFAPGEAFDAYVAAQGAALNDHCTFATLAEQHGGRWSMWPSEFKHPAAPGIAKFREANGERIRFHAWLQWICDQQLEEASREIDVMQDLAVGVDPEGADAWRWQESMVFDVGIGAPPDLFNTRGQNWTLPPFDPHRLDAFGYEPFIEVVRAALRHAGGLRIDHVMGLTRLFWIPRGMEPAQGAYVRYPHRDLLDIIALESVRADAYIVGEDLGTVEESLRTELATRDVMSYRLMLFEGRRKKVYPVKSLAAVTTHDLPTIAGLWNGTDIAEQRALELQPNESGTSETIEKLKKELDLDASDPAAKVIARTYAHLAKVKSSLVVASLDDALEVEERPNMPGTLDERPNWSIALPLSLEQIKSDERAAGLAKILSDRD